MLRLLKAMEAAIRQYEIPTSADQGVLVEGDSAFSWYWLLHVYFPLDS